jgi:hypothetical protein
MGCWPREEEWGLLESDLLFPVLPHSLLYVIQLLYLPGDVYITDF